MVELGLDPTNQDFLPDNDTVYVDEGQFTSSSILHLHLFAMPHMFMFKSSLNQQKTVFAICAHCKKLFFQIRMFFYVCFLFGGCVEGDIPRLCIAYGCLCFVFFVWILLCILCFHKCVLRWYSRGRSFLKIHFSLNRA